jgi:DNA-binding GntR family transcriptional regulator
MRILEQIDIKRPPTIREEVFKHLRKKILTGEIRPGDRLIESKLADEIRISRTPIREALHNLEKEKLIQSIPRVGYVVREISRDEVEEICEIRASLETLAAKWAAAQITATELRRLERNIQQTAKSIEKNDTRAVVRLDTEFHDIICSASKSPRIEEISQTLRDHMLRFRMKGLCIPEIAYRSNEGHRRILQAIKSGDPQEIESAVSFHLNSTKKNVTEILS